MAERNWGVNVDHNKKLAAETGYTGDFGGGKFQAWLASQSPAPNPAPAPNPVVDPSRVERNWGADAEKNKWIAQKTGYSGDFGNGLFAAWAKQNSVDVGETEDGFYNRNLDASGNLVSQDFGANADKNQWIKNYLQSTQGKTYVGDFGDNEFVNWARREGVDVGQLESAWRNQNSTNAPGPGGTTPYLEFSTGDATNSVEARLTRILGADSPLMQRARTKGLEVANSRGLLNSSMAAGTAMNSMIDAALPIASQDSQQGNQRYMQGREIDNQRYMQQQEIANQRWLATLDSDTRKSLATMQENTKISIANLNLGSEDKQRIAAMVSSVQSNYTSSYATIVNNPDIPADVRDQYLTHIYSLMTNQLSLVESMYGVDLDWS